MKNLTTPRTLAACTFETGYAGIQPRSSGFLRSCLLAAIIGVALAAVLFFGWSQT